jgi:predicted DNA-binding transcriptional regulator YafY
MQGPATRVLAVLELLQARGVVSGGDLSRALGVHGRTVRRYIAVLEELGIPVMAERGRFGGYRLVPGYKLPPMMFGDEEALALSLGLLAARGLGLADAAPAIASAQAKLERVMPAALKRRVRAADETIALDFSRGTPTGGDGHTLRVLSAAAQACQRVHLDYRSAQRADSQRDVDPYGLAWRSGRWYLVGHCHLRGGLRSFRLDRIEAVAPLPVSFARPPGFDALAHLAFSLATLPRAHAIEVFLQTDLATARREVFDAIGLLEAADGGVRLHAQADDLDWFARELARLPFAFEVRAPEALREAVRTVALRLQRMAGPRRRRRLPGNPQETIQ